MTAVSHSPRPTRSGRIEPVSSPFPTVPRRRRGYRVDEVDEFLARARAAYSPDGDHDQTQTGLEDDGSGSPDDEQSAPAASAAVEDEPDGLAGLLPPEQLDSRPALTSVEIRSIAFGVDRGGYSPTHVDAALARLEEVFAARERETAIAAGREKQWYSAARTSAQEILDRVVRPSGRRFRRGSVLTIGYSVREVDDFTDRISAYFQKGVPITAEQLRSVEFRAQRGGYAEDQVDYLLDATIAVVLAVR